MYDVRNVHVLTPMWLRPYIAHYVMSFITWMIAGGKLVSSHDIVSCCPELFSNHQTNKLAWY